jgi:hypothetical protein
MVAMGLAELLLISVLLTGGQTGLPLGLPPGPEDPLMSRLAPEECLLYTSWAPTVAADPAGNPTERWMAQSEIRDSFARLKSAIRSLNQQGNADEKAFGEVAFRLAERCLSNACGFYIREFQPSPTDLQLSGGALIMLGDDAAEIDEQISTRIAALIDWEGLQVTRETIGGLPFRQVAGPAGDGRTVITWGVIRERYLAVTIGRGEMQKLLANLESEPPAWLDDLRNEIPVDRTAALTWLNLQALVEVARQVADLEGQLESVNGVLDTTGISQLRSAGWISGLDDEGFLCRGNIHIEGPPAGLAGLLNGEPLQPEAFGKVANDRMLMTGARISLPRAFSLIRDLSNLNEFSRGEFDAAVGQLNDLIGINLEEDIINTFDDLAYLYGSPNFANPTAGWVLGIGASRQMELTDTYAKVNEFFKASCEASPNLEFTESQVNDETIYSVEDNSEWSFLPDFCWTLADGEFLLSMDKSSLRRHLRREAMAADALANDPWFVDQGFNPPRMEAGGPCLVASLDVASLLKIGVPMLATFGNRIFPPGFEYSFEDLPSLNALTQDLQPNITALYRTADGFETFQRQILPGGTPGTFLGTAVIGTIPYSMQVRSAARRTSAANQMRQLILAMHNYHDSHRAFPARFSKDDNDRPLLSWRVYVLPYLGEADLYNEFHLDEPWDSEHNKALIEKMPDCFAHPMARPEAGKTVYVVPQGDGSIMPDPSAPGSPRGARLEMVRDGTSQTAVIFEVSKEHAVIWSKPDDFPWRDMEDPVSALFNRWNRDGVNVALADGSIRFVSREKLREVLDKLITTDDGEIIDLSEDVPRARAGQAGDFDVPDR